uniref:Ribosomal protein S10 n=1 Tax=Sargassum siliquastrum TaxID=127572 RepID=A0A7G7WRN4_9PHAE|nr:ribosomal protein S10 [Sargassum siliquastrum]YP_010485645.1 ribosomal protein S10 [Sargassum fulvellum]YP_010485682.1 ribosomal protein S10 [Sargassum macrocarpum]YP_010485719.1 ribosomal protein S10 [Sargassum serratifolium]QNH69211.1 ribosomal protein S10 [Sargassum siliquastrum]UVW81717.1 ribosomal protein S10 [Sargassum fulvellum]UVW81791.1 ribosomal protein S10 [Sargassum macrocarpum]UVW81828.1 ribosomal protein S10 [Sargassum serratifolium]
MSFLGNFVYKCEVWSSSANIRSLKLLFFLLPFFQRYRGLSITIKRFTLLKSPLGNKRSKDQFEKREHRVYFYLESSKPSNILACVHILTFLNEVKCKVKVSNKLSN